MKNFLYPAKIEKGEDCFFLVTFRDIKFAATDGRTIEEAKEEAVDSLNEALASIISDNEPLPLPTKPKKGEYLIAPDALIAAKAALYVAVKEEGLSKTALAKRLNLSEAVGRRLLDPKYQTKIINIDKALTAMGRKMIIGYA
ncbi:MAG: type II toxin-antitoxin system HicB family antitoxin [Desulfobulbaceae bacterium]|nr:type II toxin-antitoxin system HicB family antitoxin [Desulfobulbaceae bacterium]